MFVEAGTQAWVEAAVEDQGLEAAPTDWIEREIGELAAHIAAATCRWLELIAEFDRRAGYEAWGFHSCGAWVAWRCSVDPRSAREHVRVARALEGLPLVHERFRCGELSFSKVRAITRIATPEIEAELVEMARFATAAQLERLVRGYRRAVSLESAEAAHRDRFLACEWEEDGSLYVRGRLAPEDGALFLKAIEQGREAIREREEEDSVVSQSGSAEPGPPRRVNGADALTEVAERSLAGGSAPRPAGERHQVVVHAEAHALAGEGERAGCRIEDGPAICAHTARRLACDASLVSAGRRSRAVPAAMRRALDARDEGRCRFPGCENRRWVDAHHIVHWARGGETKLGNLVLLCSRHHRLVHEGGFSLARKAGGALVFRRPDGRPIPAVPSPTHGSSAELRAHNREAGLRIVPDSVMPLGRGEPYDRELAVWGLLARAGPTNFDGIMFKRDLLLLNAGFRMAYGIGGMLSPAAMGKLRLAADTPERPDARLFVRAFSAHQIGVAVGLASLRRRKLRRPAALAAAAIDLADIGSAAVEACRRGDLGRDLTGGLAFSAAGAATACVAAVDAT